MNNSLHSARHELPQLASALLFNSGDPITHLCQMKDSDSPNERLKCRNDAKRSHSRDDIIHLMDSDRSFTHARMDRGTARTIDRSANI
jgi:hypothetical protein